MQRYSSRMGRFYIDGQTLASIEYAGVESREFKQAMSLLSKIFIVECRPVSYMDRLEYVGISELFEELPEGALLPEYTLEGQIIEEKNEAGAPTGKCHYEVRAFIRASRCSFCGAPR